VVDVPGEEVVDEPVSLGTVVPPVAPLEVPPSCGMVAPPAAPGVVVVGVVDGVVAGTVVVGVVTVVVGTVVVSTVCVWALVCVSCVSVLTQVTESLELPHPEARRAPAARSARRLVRGSSIVTHRSDAAAA
jgi:hypothetical protein